jgi:hypothetical protein
MVCVSGSNPLPPYFSPHALRPSMPDRAEEASRDSRSRALKAVHVHEKLGLKSDVAG